MLSLKTWRQFGACAFAYCLVSTFAHSAEVSPADAQEAVAGWAALGDALTGAERFGGREIADVATYEGADGNGAFHVVSFVGGGFAVTSGDTEVTPILAYSEEGEFAATEENPLWVLLTQVQSRASPAPARARRTRAKKPRQQTNNRRVLRPGRGFARRRTRRSFSRRLLQERRRAFPTFASGRSARRCGTRRTRRVDFATTITRRRTSTADASLRPLRR